MQEAHINFRDNFQAFRAMGAVKVRPPCHTHAPATQLPPPLAPTTPTNTSTKPRPPLSCTHLTPPLKTHTHTHTRTQVRFVLDLLEQHPALPLVVVSDTDAVWLRPPWTYFQQRPAAEFFSSSDCLSHQVSARQHVCVWGGGECVDGWAVGGWTHLHLAPSACRAGLVRARRRLQVEVEWRRDHGQPRCGHVPGNGE